MPECAIIYLEPTTIGKLETSSMKNRNGLFEECSGKFTALQAGDVVVISALGDDCTQVFFGRGSNEPSRLLTSEGLDTKLTFAVKFSPSVAHGLTELIALVTRLDLVPVEETENRMHFKVQE